MSMVSPNPAPGTESRAGLEEPRTALRSCLKSVSKKDWHSWRCGRTGQAGPALVLCCSSQLPVCLSSDTTEPGLFFSGNADDVQNHPCSAINHSSLEHLVQIFPLLMN